ncbi:hypothetical protein AZ34_16010 [Hylemonella gracilis str. Niagara R]|uniref:Nucleotidyltransferase family protein n=1 Tax=Hylemonella gracilis str. Niagara R TaxID=1458275 RepID=A0A016XKN1_9BURK|nr:hypothetical protein [Hylemonella gracilis]EYC52406.1 hypothetical protein AZ34_16010 [Hylemonella gracilis str. Niagara R]
MHAQDEIAAAAARLVVEEGLEYGPAKHRAVKALGLPQRTSLPDNDMLEDAVRDYIAVFCADTQPRELLALRRLALAWMERLVDFQPHLTGAVWRGTATRWSDVHLDLFCEDGKAAEIALIDRGLPYETRSASGLRHNKAVDVLSLHAPCRELGELSGESVVGVHLRVNDLDDLRGALLPDARGRPPRGPLQALRELVLASELGNAEL